MPGLSRLPSVNKPVFMDWWGQDRERLHNLGNQWCLIALHTLF